MAHAGWHAANRQYLGCATHIANPSPERALCCDEQRQQGVLPWRCGRRIAGRPALRRDYPRERLHAGVAGLLRAFTTARGAGAKSSAEAKRRSVCLASALARAASMSCAWGKPGNRQVRSVGLDISELQPSGRLCGCTTWCQPWCSLSIRSSADLPSSGRRVTAVSGASMAACSARSCTARCFEFASNRYASD